MAETVRLGISTCPNDTFAFHGLLSGAVKPSDCKLEIELHDVQELNEALAAGRLDIAKGSFYAAFELADELCLLRTGSALGFDNGPLLLAPANARVTGEARRVLSPGRLTTAHLLMQLLHPEEVAAEHVIFSEIMPALVRGEADLGICIHEGRFTWREQGLRHVEDLGSSWHERTGMALPLGGIFARKRLDRGLIRDVQSAISASIAHARAHPDAALVSMRRYAQEQSDEVLRAHVELYVNEHTEELGPRAAQAIATLQRAARDAGILPGDNPPLEVFDG